nr:hypothetical protein [Tanacetum cinerariifolium]
MEKAQAKSSLAIPKTDNDVKIKLSEEFLMKLRNNAYCGTDDEDVVDHIAKVLEMLILIKTSNVDTYHLRMMVFPCSLAGDARQWWINEESDYGNPPNTVTNLFFKPSLDAQENNDIEKRDECLQKEYKGNTSKLEILNKAPHSSSIKDEQLNEKGVQGQEFEVIKFLHTAYPAVTVLKQHQYSKKSGLQLIPKVCQQKGQPQAYNLDQLKESDEGTIVVMVCRKWDVHNVNGRYLSTDFVVSDEKASRGVLRASIVVKKYCVSLPEKHLHSVLDMKSSRMLQNSQNTNHHVVTKPKKLVGVSGDREKG